MTDKKIAQSLGTTTIITTLFLCDGYMYISSIGNINIYIYKRERVYFDLSVTWQKKPDKPLLRQRIQRLNHPSHNPSQWRCDH